MTEKILRCPLVPGAEPKECQLRSPGYTNHFIEAGLEPRGWYVACPVQASKAEAIAVWNEAMRKLGAKEGEG